MRRKFSEHIGQLVHDEDYKYAELRQRTHEKDAESWKDSDSFCMHMLSLEPEADRLFCNLHKDCIQRKVRRAEKERLVYEAGRSEEMVRKFYDLLLRTRRRHCLPPQPMRWFEKWRRTWATG